MNRMNNRKAYYNYEILDKMEAGIQLYGPEVKSIVAQKCNLSDAYAIIEKGECWLVNFHVSKFDEASYNNVDIRRKRKLLLHNREIKKLKKRIEEKGFTLVLLAVYTNEKGLIKVELGVAKGKHNYDKKRSIMEKEAEKDLGRIRGKNFDNV